MASRIQSYRDLDAWRAAYDLGLAVYRATTGFPDSERFGLVSQLRRGGISIASNIAEGFGRGSQADYVRFLRIARGALFELETQLSFSADLGFLAPAEHEALIQQASRVRQLISGLLRSLG